MERRFDEMDQWLESHFNGQDQPIIDHDNEYFYEQDDHLYHDKDAMESSDSYDVIPPRHQPGSSNDNKRTPAEAEFSSPEESPAYKHLK